MAIVQTWSASPATERQIASRRAIATWLFIVAALIALMVIVGGLTRLTDSGLSITSWKPIHGALPPLSVAEWQEEFDAYKRIPQYQQLNKGMTLDEFKAIFWWEWSHRNLGRLIGFAFLLPFLVFLARGQVERALIPRLVALFVLGGLQGALGWFMVASGLSERTSVSQYRLVAHLGLALAIYAAIVWTALPLWRGEWPMRTRTHPLFRWSLVVLGLIFAQILLGGFVAGLDAGFTYNTWPLMDGHFIPEGVYPSALAPFEDVTTVQFNHRMMAYVVTAAVLALWYAARRRRLAGEARMATNVLFAAVAIQVLLGIWTLLAVVHIWLGALHQAGAVAVLTAALWHAFALCRVPGLAAAPVEGMNPMTTKHYTNGEVTVTWKPDKCIHSAVCISGLPGVFDVNRNPWIDMKAATTDEIVTQVAMCPSGALSIRRNDEVKS